VLYFDDCDEGRVIVCSWYQEALLESLRLEQKLISIFVFFGGD